jgi:dipeptidyl aminopeptidase/acylaminoacyl peptidase
MTIPSYLTQPAGKPPFPMVVLPHGGPTGRDFRRFDYVAQFLASRGYAILQPNFRGSTGYGASFLAAGRKQWGLAMQDDLEDGDHHLSLEQNRVRFLKELESFLAEFVRDADRMPDLR